MANEFDVEDEELLAGERDDEAEYEEAEDDEAEDEESSVAMYHSFPRPMPAFGRFGAGRYMAPVREDRIKGVRGALIRGRDGATAVVRLPTAVATVRGVRRLGRRSARAEALLAQHDRRLMGLRRRDTHIRATIAGAVLVQHLRDVVTEARASVAAAPAPWAPGWPAFLAGTDYTLSTVQTSFSVAAIPAERRSGPFWTLPAWTGLGSALGREALRPPLGFGGKPWWQTLILVGAPTIAGAVGAFLVRPKRVSRFASR